MSLAASHISNDEGGQVAGVKLGFLEAPEGNLLHRKFFPSKVGGKPAWLGLQNLPTKDQLTCKTCGRQMMFLLQVYAPFSDFERSFHRTLFVFCCVNTLCYSKSPLESLRIFRSQLPQENPFYSPELPDDNDCTSVTSNSTNGENFDELSEEEIRWDKEHLCKVCGIPGKSRCASCHETLYCGKEHQKYDWYNDHSTQCGQTNKTENKDSLESSRQQTTNSNISKSSKRRKRKSKKNKSRNLKPPVFPEYELYIADDDERDRESHQDDFSKEKELLKRYEENQKKMNSQEKKEFSESFEDEKEDDDDESSTPSDPIYENFTSVISDASDQCIRYSAELDGNPLWVHQKGKIKNSDVPSCSSCNSKRCFEFQIMPQMLYYVEVDQHYGVDGVDWGTLVIYSCQNSCGETFEYFEEFIHYQPPLSQFDSSTLRKVVKKKK